MSEAFAIVFNVILFAALNAFVIKPESPAAWIGCALAWSAGVLIVHWNRTRQEG
jgi:hypothetical protein